MEKLDFRLPDYDLVFGYDKYLGKNPDQKKSVIFKKRGTKAKLTDYSTVLSCMYDGDENTIDKNGCYWLDSAIEKDSLFAYHCGGHLYAPINKRVVGVRPIVKFSSIKPMVSDFKVCDDGIKEALFGEYPDTIADESISSELEKIYNFNLGIGIMTEKEYTVDKTYSYHDNIPFFKKIYPEYFYEGKKYVRVPVSSYLSHSKSGVVLSDKKFHDNGSYVWLEVKPQKLLIDENNDLAVFDNVILAGIQFNRIRNYKGDFNKTFMKKYLDKYFSKEILPSVKYSDNDVKSKVKSL